jgi:WD40 repeat protein
LEGIFLTSASSLWQKSREVERRGFALGSRRRNEEYCKEIRRVSATKSQGQSRKIGPCDFCHRLLEDEACVLVACTRCYTIVSASVATGERKMEDIEAKIIGGNQISVRGMQFAADSRLFATTSADATVRLWDTATWELVRTLSGRSPHTRAIAFSSRFPYIAVSEMHHAVVYDFGSGETIGRWELGNVEECEGACWISFDDHAGAIVVVTVAECAALSVATTWSLTGPQIGRSEFNELATAIWLDDGGELCLETYYINAGSRTYRLRRPSGRVTAEVDLRGFVAGGIPVSSPDRKLIALGNRCFGSGIQLVDSARGELLLSRTGWANSTPLIAISSGNKLLGVARCDRGSCTAQLSMTNILDGTDAWQDRELDRVERLKFSPNGRILVASSAEDGLAYFLGATDGVVKRVVPRSGRSFCFSPDCRWFVSAGPPLVVMDIGSI